MTRPRTIESQRLEEADAGKAAWRKWGPYLSERQWGTVREDYSQNGDAWGYFSHDQARSRAYLWGEDGLAGFSDDKQILCFSVACWNGADPILKERLFGLTNSEGNHGEDVKEYYYYLDSTPTHSYMKYLYKYPQAAFPYLDLVTTNARRNREEPEYELIDTGIFDEDRYFDIFVEYCKATPEDSYIRISVVNRSDTEASIHLLPHLWFRNTWRSFDGKLLADPPQLEQKTYPGGRCVRATQKDLGSFYLYSDTECEFLFTENETNSERLFNKQNLSPYVKDAMHRFVVEGDKSSINPDSKGTKAALLKQFKVPPAGEVVFRLRLTQNPPGSESNLFGAEFDELFSKRKQEADEFYAGIEPASLSTDERQVMRQALAGMLWSKQYYYFDLERWLNEHGMDASARRGIRNYEWLHMVNDDVISMPDKWEYPWFAAWDLAFHCVPLAMVDLEFAKNQLLLMLHEMYQHPNGQVPAYEWNFGDVNPPVHAWAALFVYLADKRESGKGDIRFLKLAFQKLLMNFTWWVNRKDRDGRNVFEGGFLGLDNIGVFDRSSPLPTGGFLEQADGTAWMAFFCQTMLQIALELAPEDSVYEDMAQKFVEHFFRIAGAMDRIGFNADEMWDEEDGFFYDLLRFPDGQAERIKVRSVVGLLPLCATTVIQPETLRRFARLLDKVNRFCNRQANLIANLAPPRKPGHNGRHLLAIVPEDKLRKILARMLDEERFLGPHGIRALSRWHKDHPFVMHVNGAEYKVQYLPAESDNGMFGGNSNWRGPVWAPINILIIRALLAFHQYHGSDFQIECPTGSGVFMDLQEVAHELSNRLVSAFLKDLAGHRPVFGGARKFQDDPHWRDYILFYEYFHGDNGAGIGASHQTGWTGGIAKLIQLFGSDKPSDQLFSPTP